MASKLIDLKDALWIRCLAEGEAIVSGYANSMSERSRAVSTHGAERNAFLQAQAKAAECIFALTFGFAVEPVFRDSHRAYDFLLGAVRVDVKRTDIVGRYLIWPIGKNAIFESKGFDALALVKNDGPRGWVQGFIGKAEFRQLKSVAGSGHKLDPGTWHVHETSLIDTPWRRRVFCEELRAWL